MDITVACVSFCTTLLLQALAKSCYSQFSSPGDRFSWVHWPKEHGQQRGARCRRHPCDRIIWDRQIEPREGQLWSQQAAHDSVSGNRSIKLHSSPSKASHRFIKRKQSISHRLLSEAERDTNAGFAESNSSAGWLASFSNFYDLVAFVQHSHSISLLDKCSFLQDFLYCICQRIDQRVARTIPSGLPEVNLHIILDFWGELW